MQPITVLDDVLPQDEFRQMQNVMTKNSAFPWFYNPTVNFDDDPKGCFQFIHMFYLNFAPSSEFFPMLNGLMSIVKPRTLHRIKANLITVTPTIIEHGFHYDNLERNSGMKVAIFYVNTNNGYTKFDDGRKVESVENRLAIFDGELFHTGSSCTDENTRVVINFNYF